MQLRAYWVVLSKRWWLVVLLALVTSTTAYVYSKLQQPIFRSSAKLYVTPARPDYGLTLVIQNIIRQYSQQLQSDRFLNQISERERLDLPPPALRKEISTSGTADNLAIQIDVDDPDPGRAQRIARALAVEFLEVHQARMENVDKRDKIYVEMLDDPEPGALHRPRTKVNVVAGALLGLLLGGVLAFLFEYLDDTIKDPEDVERYMELPVVGSIPTIAS